MSFGARLEDRGRARRFGQGRAPGLGLRVRVISFFDKRKGPVASGGVRRGEFGPTAGAGRGLRPGRPRGCGAVGPRGRGRAKAHNRPGRGRGKDEAGLTSARSQEVTASSLHSAARRRLPLLRSRAARTGSGSGRLSEGGGAEPRGRCFRSREGRGLYSGEEGGAGLEGDKRCVRRSWRLCINTCSLVHEEDSQHLTVL